MYQSYEGQVDSTTAFVEYDYDGDGRLVGMTYPSGKRLQYKYHFAGQVTAIRNGEGMVQVLENECSSSGSGWNPQPTGNEIVRYVRDGAGRFMQTNYVELNLTLNYTDGLDRFGRIVDHAWTNGNGDNVVRIQHNYDMSGNRLNRIDSVNPLNSEAYSYDSMGQIKSLTRNDFWERWTFGATGNWVQYDKNGIVENRSHNKANEILPGIIHDANGNMTQIPSPKGDGNLNCVYDAWNSLIKINDNICYEYNSLNHRVKKTVNNVVTKSFFNEKWQELESNTNDDSTTYIWGLRYVDDLIYRDKNDERRYSLADPNWNVIATTDEIGIIQERFRYDAFGKVNGLNSDWNRTFTGQVLDNETGLMLYRNRFYHTDLGRFTTRDPIGYRSQDISIYRYVGNSSINKYDMLGLAMTKTGVKYCAGYQKGAIFLGGIMPTHWFVMIDGIGIGKFEENLCSVGKGQIRYDDHIIYPETDSEKIDTGYFYSKCEDIMLDDSCYDIDGFKTSVRNYANKPAGTYIAGLLDCRDWIFSAVCESTKNNRSRDSSWGSFCKCMLVYGDEDCGFIHTDGGIKLR